MKEFDEWYAKQQTFDFKQQFLKYCKSDVDILRRSCSQYRQLYMDMANIDKFQYITLAQCVMQYTLINTCLQTHLPLD